MTLESCIEKAWLRYFRGLGLSNTKGTAQLNKMDLILNYIDQTKGLHARLYDNGSIEIVQDLDQRKFRFSMSHVVDVLDRLDSEGKGFLQVNFTSGLKILVTDTLIGFKPAEVLGLDMGKLPKVVTTPDLSSVKEAIEDSLDSDGSSYELEVLKKVFQSILDGAEKVGFSLNDQRIWISRISASKFTAAA